MSIQKQLLIYLLGILAPIILYMILAISGVLSGIDISVIYLLSIFLLSTAAYYYLSYTAYQSKQPFDLILGILFYANYVFFMIMVLVSFNLIIIGGFLFTDQVPMGLELNPDQALGLVLTGIYLFAISSVGMYYLSWSKKEIRKKAI